MTDLAYTAILPKDATQRVAADSWRLQRSVLMSCGVHALIFVLLMQSMQLTQPPPARRSIRAVMLAPTVQEGPQAAPSADTSTPAAVPLPTQTPPQPKPAPKPALAAPKPPPTVSSPPPKKMPVIERSTTKAEAAQAQASTSKQNKPATSPAPVNKAGAEVDDDSDSLLSQLRTNWLPPPRSAPVFRCRLRIAYRAGGLVTGVAVDPGCSDRVLGDSIERAVWKTQPLPLAAGSPSAGSIDIEFTP